MDTILIIDDEPVIRKLLSRMMELEGYEVFQAADCQAAFKQMKHHTPQVTLCDVFLPDGNGVEMVPEIKKIYPWQEIILLTAHGNISDGVQAIKNGAFDYIIKGDDNNKIIPLISRAMEQAKRNIGEKEKTDEIPDYSFETIIVASDSLRQTISLAQKVAATDVTVLLSGETGTGKEVFAQAIHRASHRKDKDFIAVNCSAFSKDLLESEVFGYKAGAFTGAVKDKRGLFEVADNGTLFLDEIGEMAFELQAKLLRVLESGEYIKIGDTKPTKVNVRVISATNRDLKREVEQGNFREDLFYRLSVFQIQIPPLRERKEDISLLADYFIARFSKRLGKKIESVTPEFMTALKTSTWKGNVRELRNVIERSLIVCDKELTLQDLPIEMQNSRAEVTIGNNYSEFELAAMEKRHIAKVLQHTNGNKTEASRLLKIGLTTLYRKIEEYGI
ncbi:MAG: sigma-54 dependent transcriptional regulator [Bacteroidales bacterium]